ncbi:glycosyltransferase family 4 protein [Microbacterium album]|uniref:D-inositol 3-phosphate glycosyltransferase n=1 Tax=Microbacterium album TaxID=2053191 RepID=A0A917MLY8_9MICO|nr:glycosyltransferase family 4 protein [Microbacterium album]GGH41188.1 hypothetical protein GCM10010921_13600 [Microbacterium album]
MTPVRIWHIGASANPQTVNGANQAIWALARAQALRGHQVVVVAKGKTPVGTARTLREAISASTRTDGPDGDLIALSALAAIRSAGEARPDVVHMHSVYSPSHAAFAAWALLRRIPYIVTPHGGYLPNVLAKHSLPKKLYRSTVERWRVRNAAAVVAVAEPEVGDIERFSRRSELRHAVVPNIVEMETPESTHVASSPTEVIYLGRLDVEWKGIDRIAAIAERLPHRTFTIFGKNHPSMSALRLPDNVTVRAPVYGDEKRAVLAGARVLLQLSRWEVFGMSVLEALLCGTQVMVSDTMYLAPWVEANGGLVLRGADVAGAAAALEEYLLRPRDFSREEARRQSARAYLDHSARVAQVERLYREVLAN